MPDKPLQTGYEKPEGKTPDKTPDDRSAVEKAKDEATIAEENRKAEFARQGIKDIKQLIDEKAKLTEEKQSFYQEIDAWEKQKEEWLLSFESEKEKWETGRQAEIEKVRKVKEYYEGKKDQIDELEQDIIARENTLTELQKTLDSQEQRIDLLMGSLDGMLEQKKAQIAELQEIIDSKAHRYYEEFKQMLKTAEGRYNYNYNMARADQWHNLKERTSIIFRSLHEMLFGG